MSMRALFLLVLLGGYITGFATAVVIGAILDAKDRKKGKENK